MLEKSLKSLHDWLKLRQRMEKDITMAWFDTVFWERKRAHQLSVWAHFYVLRE